MASYGLSILFSSRFGLRMNRTFSHCLWKSSLSAASLGHEPPGCECSTAFTWHEKLVSHFGGDILWENLRYCPRPLGWERSTWQEVHTLCSAWPPIVLLCPWGTYQRKAQRTEACGPLLLFVSPSVSSVTDEIVIVLCRKKQLLPPKAASNCLLFCVSVLKRPNWLAQTWFSLLFFSTKLPCTNSKSKSWAIKTICWLSKARCNLHVFFPYIFI